MKRSALIFPGQGAQYVGMGKELCAESAVARAVFERANAELGFDLAAICFEGPAQQFTQSAVCQPAILTLSIAAYSVLKNEFAELLGALSACAGLSLGEYSALVACGSLCFEDAVRLVHKRGQFMDEASAENPGTMACILGLDLEKAESVCADTAAEIANLNCPGQIVISGTHDSIAKASELAQKAGAKRVIPLDVSGPFHSSLMLPAAEKLSMELEKVTLQKPVIPFIPNVTADFLDDEKLIKELLTKQVSHTTYWEKSIINMKDSGIELFYELGPGKVLRGLLQRIDLNLQVVNLEKSADFLGLREKVEETA
ncbi:MAG: ACP S-malonyltransferase [Candidatus Omnitrophica bacterium]|nr:ACP S-malonyltransferase [Candidatus Omnitrophota bacterium]MBU4477481.1 ACP S-malonyltransferase [Candidatus Omnitrophota bacterium]MCG2704285.1 ACP S-malonyltransferase [Candidatus Omnitrophota bacterium]